MSRILLALLVMGGFAAGAGAQQPPTILLPDYRPGGPGAPAGIGPVMTRPEQPGIIYFTAIAPWGWAIGWGYQTNEPGIGPSYVFGGYLPNGYVQPVQPVSPVTIGRPKKTESNIALSNEFPATLSVQFPAPAEVWLDGEAQSGGAHAERVLTSRVLKPGEQHTFKLKARWSDRGTTYETVRTVTLGSGDRSRLFIVSGTEVRE